MVCLALELVGPWVVPGFSVGMKAFDGVVHELFIAVTSLVGEHRL